MDDTDEALARLAEAIADATPVDWPAASLTPGGERGQVEALRAIAAVAAAYRSAAADQAAGDVTTTTEITPSPRRPLFRWGHLEVVELLGSGTFGDVYRAQDPLLDRAVALKLRRSEAPLGARERDAFIREARSLARVRHPNVVVVHGADTHDDRLGLWTDLVEGHTLEERLAFEGPMDAREAALVGIDLCGALSAVHAAGLAHGDVKASNVMRERGGRTVLMDFGAGSESTATGSERRSLFGTPLAMPPEVLRGGRPGPQSDIYALGVLLHRLVSGRYPFPANDLGELLAAHERNERTSLAELCPTLPPAFVHTVERALAARPADRWPSAAAMKRGLESFLGAAEPGRGLPAGRSFGRELVRRWTATSAGVRTVLAVTALALAAVAVVLGVRAVGRRAAPDGGPVRTVAVLPFQILGAGRDDAYLGLAMADALINRLSRLKEIRVRPTGAVAGLREVGSDYRAVARALEVDALLDGRLQRLGDRVRVSVQLVDGTEGTPVWAATFDRATADIFALQDSISEQTTQALQLRLSAAERASLASRPTSNAEAYQAYLKGRYLWNRRSQEALHHAIEHFQRATSLDPGFALAWAGLADTWLALPNQESQPTPEAGAYATARRAADRAVALDSSSADVHATLGNLRFRADWDWEGAESELERAIQLDPRCVTAHQWKAELLSLLGRHDEAIAEAEIAEQIDPVSLPVTTTLAAVLLAADRADQAIDQLIRVIELDAEFLPATVCLGHAFEAKGQTDRAVGQWQQAMALTGVPSSEIESLGAAFAGSGIAGAWAWRLHRLEAQATRGWASPSLRARALAALGEPDGALTYIARSVETHDPLLLVIFDEPALTALRTDPRFVSLTTRLGFPGST